MTDKPKIPYDPPRNYWAGEAKRWVRKLAESGKLSGRPVKRIPHYGKTDEPPELTA